MKDVFFSLDNTDVTYDFFYALGSKKKWPSCARARALFSRPKIPSIKLLSKSAQIQHISRTTQIISARNQNYQMGRPRKRKAKTKATPPPPISTFSIGNCKVEIHGKGLTFEPTEENVTILAPNDAKIVVSVDGSRRSVDGIGQGYDFFLLNPKDVDNRSKTLFQEVLKLYMQELPIMDYAADTGKNSGFLERCISSGKYKTLILGSKSSERCEEVIAAISFQIVPSDTQNAEVPLAAVNSAYQHVGIGQLLYKELSQRLQNVGVLTIFCWADKVSEGFWLKQGFVSVGEVDTKGKIRRLPIRADIRRALCFPGGSTLMVTHLQTELRSHPKTSQEKLHASQFHAEAPDSISPGDIALPLCGNLVSQTFGCCKISKSTEVTRNEFYTGSGSYSLSEQQLKKWICETSSSSLLSKRIRCSHLIGHCQDMKQNDFCDNRLQGTCKHDNSMHLTPKEPSVPCSEACAEGNRSGDAKACLASKGSSNVMLMNIADETKKTCLTKIVENLGGFVTSEGSSSTHVITGKARRTMNFCIALCSGAWIVSPNWLKESFRQGMFVGEEQYVLEDEEYKIKYKSELRDAFMRAKEKPCSLFSGYTICLTKHIQPSVVILSAIIKSSGGKVISKLDDLDEPSRTIFLACEEDMDDALAAAKRGIRTFSNDWFMSCVMKQQLDLEAPQFAESL